MPDGTFHTSVGHSSHVQKQPKDNLLKEKDPSKIPCNVIQQQFTFSDGQLESHSFHSRSGLG